MNPLIRTSNQIRSVFVHHTVAKPRPHGSIDSFIYSPTHVVSQPPKGLIIVFMSRIASSTLRRGGGNTVNRRPTTKDKAMRRQIFT
jgi:hypothetical protein